MGVRSFELGDAYRVEINRDRGKNGDFGTNVLNEA